jgi:hypothetical protein
MALKDLLGRSLENMIKRDVGELVLDYILQRMSDAYEYGYEDGRSDERIDQEDRL